MKMDIKILNKNTERIELNSSKTKRDLSQQVNDFLIEQTAVTFIANKKKCNINRF